MMNLHTLERTQIIARPLKEVFAFFATPENLAKLTPRRLDFRVMTPPPVEMKQGAIFDYQIRLAGVPVRWTSLIETYEPMKRFVDVQLKGPYSYWHHTHTFEEVKGGTRIGDRVVYAMPFGGMGNLVHSLLVRKDLQSVFDHRERTIREIFA